jgi:hypothetical protein
MIIEVKQVEPTLSLVIVALLPPQDMPYYKVLSASQGRMTETDQDFVDIVLLLTKDKLSFGFIKS